MKHSIFLAILLVTMFTHTMQQKQTTSPLTTATKLPITQSQNKQAQTQALPKTVATKLLAPRITEQHPSDNQLIAKIVPQGREIQLINTETGKVLTLTTPALCHCIKFHPHGVYLATGDQAGNLILWDIFSDSTPINYNFNQPIEDIDFNLVGNYLAIAFRDNVKIWDMSRSIVTRTFESANKQITSICFSPASDHLAIVDGTLIHVWQLYQSRVQPKEESNPHAKSQSRL